jgi:hypothetical protein
MESAPVSASSAASGGATGLTDGDEPGATGNASLFRRHPIASGVTAGAVAVILVAGLTAWGVGTAVTASLTSSTSGMPMGLPTATATPTPTPAAPTKPATGRQAAGRLAFRASIQAMDGDSWTILTRKGATVTITVNGETQFGTKKAPETSGSFAVGDSIIIVAAGAKSAQGTASGATAPIAIRVVTASDLGSSDGSSTGTNTTPIPGMTTPPNA